MNVCIELFLKIFYISIFRTVNIPSINEAVDKVTTGKLMRNSSRTLENVAGADSKEVSISKIPEVAKDCSVVIEKSQPKVIPKAHRSKPLMRPNKNPTCKTLANLKKANVSDEGEKKMAQLNVIEDCHLTMEDSSYGDWLIQEGIDMDAASPLASPDKVIITDESHKINDETIQPEEQAMTPDEICKKADVLPDSSV